MKFDIEEDRASVDVTNSGKIEDGDRTVVDPMA